MPVIQCPHCSKSAKVKEELAGKRVKCPHCSQLMQVPEAAVSPGAAAGRTQAVRMDPYLEAPRIWTGLHVTMIVYISNYLQPQLRPRYVAAVEERVYVEGPNREISSATALAELDVPKVVRVPTLEVHEAYLNILDLQSGQKVVTTLEVVSPTNKYAGPGRDL
jgi:predicted Zn finger-like uncharacterized protein